MVADVNDPLPEGAVFFVVNQGETDEVIRHVLEKVYLPLPLFPDNLTSFPQSVGGNLYQLPGVGLPFGRSFVVDGQSQVTHCFGGYNPGTVLNALSSAQ